MSQLKNKKVITALFALSCIGMLAGCSEVEAKPLIYDDAILLKDGQKVDVYDNFMGDLYDAIAKGKNDRVLEEFLKVVVKEQFGSYDELKGLAAGKAKAEDMDQAAVKTFVENHKKVYERDSDESLATKTGSTVEKVRAQRVFDTYQDVYKRINKAIYNEITSSSYVEDGIFSEQKYAFAKYADFYNVDVTRTDFFKGYTTKLATPLTEEDVSGVINLDNYKDYIDRKIAPGILKEKIVEEYLYKNYYSTLGRAYARNVNTIKLTAPSDDVSLSTLPYAVMRAYVDLAIYKVDANVTGLTFENLENAWRGFKGLDKDGNIVQLDDNEKAILTRAGLSFDGVYIPEPGTTINYVKETKLGVLLEKWNLVNNDAVDGNRYPDGEEGTNGKVTSALNLFTGSNSYPKAVGFKKELAKVSEEEYTKDGWFVKNGGLSDYPSDSIRGRLFNINVSNNLDDESVTMETAKPTDEFARAFDQTKQYVRYINDNHYLIPDKYELNSFAYNMIIIDGTNYYMVMVNEAPSTSKLNLDKGYATMEKHKADPLYTERTAMEIAQELSNKDTYANNAYAKYVEEYSLEYHDQSLLDYFKEQFPDLFEDK